MAYRTWPASFFVLFDRNIYAANGVYRITSWPVSEIEAQIEISRDPARRDRLSLGNILFSAKYFRDNTKGITDTFQEQVYTVDAKIPPSTTQKHLPTDKFPRILSLRVYDENMSSSRKWHNV